MGKGIFVTNCFPAENQCYVRYSSKYMYMLALLYNFTSAYINILSCRRDESKTKFPLQEGIFIYSRVFVTKILVP